VKILLRDQIFKFEFREVFDVSHIKPFCVSPSNTFDSPRKNKLASFLDTNTAITSDFLKSMEEIRMRRSSLLSKTMSLTREKPFQIIGIKTSKTKQDDEDQVSDEESPVAKNLSRMRTSAFTWKSSSSPNRNVVLAPLKVVTFQDYNKLTNDNQ
jgi:hypothetical protein